MAKQNDVAETALNIGIVAAVAIGIYFLYKYIKNHVGGGDTLFGSANSPSTGTGNQPGQQQPQNTFQKIAIAYHDEIAHPAKMERMGYELALAEEQAKRYMNKPGTNIIINRVLKAVNSLSDPDFIAVINTWLQIIHQKEFFDTCLATAEITTAARSEFLVRFENLTGNKGASSKVVKNAAKAALSMAHL